MRALVDPEHHKPNLKGWAKRVGYAISAGALLSLAWFALTYALHGYAVRGGDSEEGWTARVLQVEAGGWIVALAGVGILALALN